jgi:integrase
LNIVRAVLRFSGRRDVEIPRLKDDGAKTRPPTKTEVIALMKAAPPHLRRVIILSCATGVRPGKKELFALRWEHVDWESNEIYVESAEKGGMSRRMVPVSSALLPHLRQWFKDDGEIIGMPIINYRGEKITTIRKSWATAKKAAGITRRMRPYDLRHHFATYALGSGADVKSVSEIMGHKDTRMTQDIYQHVIAKAKRQAVEFVNFEPTKPANDGLQNDLHSTQKLQ